MNIRHISLTVLLIFLAFVGPAVSARSARETLYGEFSDRSVVSVYIHPVSSLVDQADLDTAEFHRRLSNTFLTRMTINFEPVDEVTASDIEVLTKITLLSFPYEERARGRFSRLLSVLFRRDRVRMQGSFEVRSHDAGHILFRRDLKASAKLGDMSRDEAVRAVTDRMISNFFREAFSRREDTGRI